MGIEIERRFLVKNEDWKSQIVLSEDFSQAYLNSSIDEWATRVRVTERSTKQDKKFMVPQLTLQETLWRLYKKQKQKY